MGTIWGDSGGTPEIIHTITRQDLINNGTLVDLMQPGLVNEVRKAGFTMPVAMTATAFNRYCISGRRSGDTTAARVWDMLFMLRLAIRCANTRGTGNCNMLRFSAKIGPRVAHLKAVCSPMDPEGKPGIVILLPEES